MCESGESQPGCLQPTPPEKPRSLDPLPGANLDVDVPWKWLNFFLEDDERLAQIGAEYGAGRMLTGEIKAELAQVGRRRGPRVEV